MWHDGMMMAQQKGRVTLGKKSSSRVMRSCAMHWPMHEQSRTLSAIIASIGLPGSTPLEDFFFFGV